MPKGERNAFTSQITFASRTVRSKASPIAGLETFGVAQMAHASSAGPAIAGMAARFAAGSGAMDVVVREHQDLIERWRLLDAEITKAVSLMPNKRNPAEEANLRASIDDATRRLEALDARIAAEF